MTTCYHCDEEALPAVYEETDPDHLRPFCCQGCLTVFKVLSVKGLKEYYEIKKQTSIYKRRSPVELKENSFKYLDTEDFLAEYSYRDLQDRPAMEFYLEGIHCLACLWLIEKLPEIVPTIEQAKLDLSRSVVTVTLKGEGLFQDAARELDHLGYRPHALKKNDKSQGLKKKTERMSLLRIGVAGAAAGNIMIYAVSLYGGASGTYASLFNLLTVLFAIPVFTFCAFPFYQSAWVALKNKSVSIDVPISLALVMGGIMGITDLFLGRTENYFDSLTALVFLLLLSRYFLRKLEEEGLSAGELHLFFQSESVIRLDHFGREEEIHPKFLNIGDRVRVKPREFIPADGKVLEGHGHVDTSLLTGESLPQRIQKGDAVWSGTQNIEKDLILSVEKLTDETRLGQILKHVQNGQSLQSHVVELTNRVAKYFTLSVTFLSLTLFVFLSLNGDIHQALERALTLLIVTCPCALALSIPLTFTRVLEKAAAKGIFIKNDAVIEKISKIRRVFLDKTGTVTLGKLSVAEFRSIGLTEIPLMSVVASLEKNAHHPAAKALFEFALAAGGKIFSVREFHEITGRGVTGLIHDRHYTINREGVFEDGLKKAEFILKDTLRGDSPASVRELLNRGLEVHLISGDKRSVVDEVAMELDLSHAESELLPEDKGVEMARNPHSMMVGDGANDAMALSEASVGVAVRGAMDISLRAADVYLTTPGLSTLPKLFTIADETMKVIRRNLWLSLSYNLVSVSFAFTGHISPLTAAVIMPLSSLTVLISSSVGTKKMRSVWKS